MRSSFANECCSRITLYTLYTSSHWANGQRMCLVWCRVEEVAVRDFLTVWAHSGHRPRTRVASARSSLGCLQGHQFGGERVARHAGIPTLRQTHGSYFFLLPSFLLCILAVSFALPHHIPHLPICHPDPVPGCSLHSSHRIIKYNLFLEMLRFYIELMKIRCRFGFIWNAFIRNWI